ncbi:MAG: L-threonylcarbamoyladenylate synthase [Bacteroidetes bacterium]|nr:L-threonylcarbamoyladenylate synthase [Bacteroidota bacterium]
MNNEEFKQEVIACLDALNSGGTILYPTDTIWGIGCDATRADAVSKIYKIKKRMSRKSLIVLLDSPNKLSLYVEEIPLITWDLLKSITTPLTIIYPKGRNLAHNVLGEDGSVAIRIADHEFCREMIRQSGRPVVSTSANLSGDANPHSYHDINPSIMEQVDHTVGLYHDAISSVRPSRIIKLYENGEFNVIRP